MLQRSFSTMVLWIQARLVKHMASNFMDGCCNRVTSLAIHHDANIPKRKKEKKEEKKKPLA